MYQAEKWPKLKSMIEGTTYTENSISQIEN